MILMFMIGIIKKFQLFCQREIFNELYSTEIENIQKH